MFNFFCFFLDLFIPEDFAEFNQREDFARARMVITAMWVNIVITLVGFISTALGGELAGSFAHYAQVAALTTLVGYIACLFIFRASASFLWVGNLYGVMAFISLISGLITIPSEEVSSYAALLLVVPLFVNLTAGLASGLSWALLVALTPFALRHYWLATAHNAIFPPLFMNIWITLTALLAFILYSYEYVSRQMSIRLNTERAKFEFEAAHDPLTGLPNRATFDRRIREAIEQSQFHREKIALLYIDLNDFKPINDQYGHQAGDTVLITVANRLLRMVRASDTVARLGGDEFVVLFTRVKKMADLERLIERMKIEIAEPVTMDNLCLMVSASIGVVNFPEDGTDAETLMQRADALMYEQKQTLKQEQSLK